MTPAGASARWRSPVRVALAALVAALALLAGAGPAVAHAELVSADPADGAVVPRAPERVTLTFSEPVRLTGRRVAVYDAGGDPVATVARASGSVVTVDLADAGGLARGTYVVEWYLLSADGHPESGATSFSVVEPSDRVAPPPPAPTSSGVVTATQGVLVGLTYLGLLTAAGLAAFAALVLPAAYDGQRLRHRIRGLARVAAVVAGLGALLQVPVASAYTQGLELGDTLASFDPGLVGDELLAAALVLVGLTAAVATLPDLPPTGRRRLIVLAGAGIALLAPAVAGHTRSQQPVWLLVVSDVVHVSAGAVWLGGLLGLVLSLRALAGRERLAAATLARFSGLAGGLLVAVAIAGSVLAWRILGSWSGFVDTGYGRLLLVKIGLAVAVAGIGAWNRFGMLHRVRSAAGHDDRGRAAALVTRTVTAEALVMVALLGVTGFLVDRSPRPAAAAPEPVATETRSARLGDLLVYVDLSPGVRGANTVRVHLHGPTGELVTPRRTPVVSLRTAGLDLGDVPVSRTADDSYAADVLLPRSGSWAVRVSVRLGRADHPVTSLRFDVAEPG